MSKRRADIAPDQVKAFRNFNKEVFKEGTLDEKTKQLISVASEMRAGGYTHAALALDEMEKYDESENDK